MTLPWGNKMKFSMIHHVDQATINRMHEVYTPVFVLTTGRTGSRLLVELLNCSPGLVAFHEPRPTLQYFSDFAFHHQNEGELLRHMVAAARMESVLEVMIRDEKYVESNQCMTFFAPALNDLFPNARFIHLVRHPGDFRCGFNGTDFAGQQFKPLLFILGNLLKKCRIVKFMDPHIEF